MIRRWSRALPAHIVNGLTVAIGIGLVELLVRVAIGAAFAQVASTGALLASLPHLGGRARSTLGRTLVGGLLGTASSITVLSVDSSLGRGLVVFVIVFAALLLQAWGARAGPITFSVVLGLVFSMAQPAMAEQAMAAPASPSLLHHTLGMIAGVVSYSLWAFLTARALESHYRTLATVASLNAAAGFLRARAEVLLDDNESSTSSTSSFVQVSEQTRLAETLQTARDLVFSAVNSARAERLAAILAHITELREIVMTSRLDLDRLGRDSGARFLRARLAVGLRRFAGRLDELERALRYDERPALAGDGDEEPIDWSEAERLLHGDERARIVPVLAARLRYMAEEVHGIADVLGGGEARPSLAPAELDPSGAEHDTWPLAALRGELTLSSPVFRHALRSALAITATHLIAGLLPWATRPYWIVLSVAVVLRGTLDNTISRRNDRVLGTALGCVLVAVMVSLFSDSLLRLSFFAAAGVAHAFVNVRYLLTALSGTVMALLQARFLAGATGILLLERLLDTVAGAILAWAFSYVLPSWERRSLRATAARAFDALRAYCDCVLSPGCSRAVQREARQHAYDALAALSLAIRRSAAEPTRVRLPVVQLLGAVDHAQRLMAHMSSVRLLLARRSTRLDPDKTAQVLEDARRRLDELLVAAPESEPSAPNTPVSQRLPSLPPALEPFPWLARRLEVSIDDAAQASRVIRAALASLTPDTALEQR